MTNMQVTVGVWRWHDNRERLALPAWRKAATGFPEGVYFWFVVVGGVLLG